MMIRVARIGSRNRVVLPVEVMDVLGLSTNDAVFFLIHGREVRMSRGPDNFAEYLQLHAEPLPPVVDFDEEDDPRQMRFGWQEDDQ